ncbi:restriction endonuclease subunit S [Bacteroidia bacterium]|nr:restriction endonuclease subunit S [Bacteroidia bacterium]
MREDWENEKLQNICYQITDIDHKMPKAKEDGVAFISAKDLDNDGNIHFENCKKISEEDFKRLSRKISPKEGDIIYSRIGTIGRASIVKVDFPFLASYSCCTIKPNTTVIENKFLRDYLASYSCLSQALSGVVGIGVPDLGMRQIREFSIPIPSLPEQRAIVSKIEELFSDLDKGVADLKKAQDQLKVYRQAVLKKAFEGDLTSGVTIKTTELENLSSQIHYGYTASSNKVPIGPHLLRITDIQNNNVDWKNVPFCAIAEDKINDYLLQKGDILFARTGATVGKSFLIANDIPKSVFASYLIRVQLKGDVLPQFIAYFFQSPKYWIQIGANSVGIGQPNVNGSKLKKLLINFPESIEEQHQIVQEIESRLSVCDKVEESISESLDKAEALRQSILKKAFEGNLLSTQEIEKCKTEPDYEPAAVLLEKIKMNQ